jgi:hypothetical protein
VLCHATPKEGEGQGGEASGVCFPLLFLKFSSFSFSIQQMMNTNFRMKKTMARSKCVGSTLAFLFFSSLLLYLPGTGLVSLSKDVKST